MTSQDFVSCIRREVLEQNIELYLHNLERAAQSGNGSNDLWPRMSELYQSLDEVQRREFMIAVRQIIVDTLSNIFGVLDGSTLLKKHRDYFHLTYGGESKDLNGNLQDLFLSPET